MNTSKGTPESDEKLGLSQPDGAAQQLELPPGFALPEAVLHSIPLPPDFDEMVQSAAAENRVETILPKFFNPLFRRQGVVNKHTIQALASVGQSLSQLAREIESRDRVLEKLTTHLNASGEHVHRRQLAIVRFAEQLARHVDAVTGALRDQIEHETAATRMRSDALYAVARSVRLQINRLEGLTANINHRLAEISSATEQGFTEANALVQASLDDQRRTTASQHTALNLVREKLENLGRETQEALINLESRITRQTNELVMASIEEMSLRVSGLEKEQSASLADSRNEAATRLADADQRAAGQFADLRQQTDALAADQARTGQRLDTLESHLATALENLERRMLEIETRLNDQASILEKAVAAGESRRSLSPEAATETATREESFAASARALTGGLATHAAEIADLRNDLRTLAEFGTTISRRQESAEAKLAGTDALLKTVLPALRVQLRRLKKIAGDGTHRQAALDDANESVETARSIESDAFYVALEARFRGSATLIRERQSRYLALVEDARRRVDLYPPSVGNDTAGHRPAGTPPGGTVLDLGCGRGEWLALLKEKGIPAVGVDRNRFFLQTCRDHGCEVVDSDMIEFLRTVPDESFVAVTGFHIIEHLPFAELQSIVRQIYRILRRGGAVMLETPNPGNVLTSCLNFLLDPTHLRPVHPELSRFVLESTGFTSVQLDYLSAMDQSHNGNNSTDPLIRRFNDYFHGPQEYAVTGVKP